MRDRMAALGDADPVLPWLAAGQFVFLGSAEFDVGADGALTLRPGSELGLARDDDRAALAAPDAGRRRRRHRPHRRHVAGLPRRPPDGGRRHRPAGGRQTRFVGLLATNAYRVSVLDIPGIGPAVADALDLTPARMHTHTGRATRTVLENLPRDLVFELEPSALARLVAAIVGLQERQLVRVFEVPEPVGPWITVLVYLPADPLHRRAARNGSPTPSPARTRPNGGCSSRTSAPARSPASPSASAAPTASGRSTWRRSSGRSTSCRRRGPTGCGRRSSPSFGEDRGRALFERVGEHAPPAYRAAVPPERAISDVRRIAALLAGDGELTTSLGHDVDAPPGEWRFRVYRRGQPAALSELLPLLDHLGLQALDERPYTFRVDDRARVRLRHRRTRRGAASSSTSTAAAALQDAFAALVAGDIESDGYNRLVLQAGLSAREVAMVRAYGKYLRQIGFAFSQSLHRGRAQLRTRCSSPISSSCSTPASTRRASPARRASDRERRRRRCGERRRRGARRHPVASTTTASAAPSSR